MNAAAGTRFDWRTPLVPVAVAVGFALLSYRAARQLTFDGYHYCELAKQFGAEWPDRFGNHWPFGYPLAGGLLCRLGLPAYESLVLVSTVSLFFLFAVAGKIIATHPHRILVLASLAAAPIVAVQLLGLLTELPFAAALLGLVFFLSQWPARRALWSAAACAVLALTIRYAGLIAFAVMGVWTICRWRELRKAQRQGDIIVVWLLTLATVGGLLMINVLKTGYASGAGRGGAPGLGALPWELADFGWSVPSAMFAGGLRTLVAPSSAPGRVIGVLIFLMLAAICFWAWRQPRSGYSRPLALCVLGYATGMAVLHCIGDFDALYNARTFLPALVPAGLLVAEQLAARREWLLASCLVLLLSGGVAALRGVSREIGGDVQAALSLLRPRLAPDDTVMINDNAFSLAAYLPQRTSRVWAEYWRNDFPARFVVICAKPTDRAGTAGQVSAAWLELSARLVASGRWKYLIKTPALIALEQLPADQ